MSAAPRSPPEHLRSRCLSCGYWYDSEAPIGDDGARPGPGSIALCINCGAPEIWTDSMMRRKLTFEEWSALERADKARVATGIVAIVIRGRFK